jgi:hypothetical protein
LRAESILKLLPTGEVAASGIELLFFVAKGSPGNVLLVLYASIRCRVQQRVLSKVGFLGVVKMYRETQI